MSQADAAKEQIKERNRQRAHENEQRRLQEAFNSDGQLDRGWMQEILNTDDLEEYLDEYEIRKIRGLVNRQQVLSNLTDAEVHDRMHKLDVIKIKIYGAFPPDESGIQGPVRAFLYDDEYENLTALTAEQRIAIDQIIMSLKNMIARSRGGFERKQMNTNIARTEREETENDESGGRLGLFS